MNTITEQVLRLSKKEKLELYHVLQRDLGNEIGDDHFTKEEWEEVERRYNDIEEDDSQFMSGDEFTEKLNALSHELRSKRS